MIPTRRAFWLGALALVVLVVGAGSPDSVHLAWLVVGAVLGATLVDVVLASQARRKLSFERKAPAQLYVEQPQPIEWTIENRSQHALSVALRDMLPESGRADPHIVEGSLPPRSRSALTYTLRMADRGQSEFGDAWCRLRGPLGLAWRQFRVPSSRAVRVLPHLANWVAAELAERRALMRQVGSHRYRWRGSGTMFESLRDYSTQDDIRWIDWKATARMQKPISRNFEVERHQTIMLLVDASRMMSTYCGLRTKFDAVLEAAVLATHTAIDQGDAAGLVLFSDRIDAYLAPRRDHIQNTRVMDALYERYPRLVDADYETALGVVSQRLRRRSLIVIFTDVTVVEAAERLLQYVQSIGRRHLCLVVTIADENLQRQELIEPRTGDELYVVGVANQLMLERAELLERLRRFGADVLDSPADQIATRTIERYLDLKRRLRF